MLICFSSRQCSLGVNIFGRELKFGLVTKSLLTLHTYIVPGDHCYWVDCCRNVKNFAMCQSNLRKK